MTLLAEIQAKCSPELIASKEHGAIAALVSEGRTKIVERIGGIGTVLRHLGPVDGPALLDALDALRTTVPAIRWGWVLLDRGQLDFGSPVVRQLIDQLAIDGVMTSAHAELLKGLAVEPDPVSVQEVASAMEGL
jgi:hypothetical protein